MYTEEDTFNRLVRCSFLELRSKILASGCTFPGDLTRSEIIKANHWSETEYDAEWKLRYWNDTGDKL